MTELSLDLDQLNLVLLNQLKTLAQLHGHSLQEIESILQQAELSRFLE